DHHRRCPRPGPAHRDAAGGLRRDRDGRRRRAAYRRPPRPRLPPVPQHRPARAAAPARGVAAEPHRARRAGVRHRRRHPHRGRPDPPPHGRSPRGADHRHRAGDRRRRTAGAEPARGDLAGQRLGPLPPRGRPAPRPARPELHRRRAGADRRGRHLPFRDDQAGRLPVAQPHQRLAAGAHPLLAVRHGVHAAPRDADVLPGRPAVRPRPDLPVGHRREGPAAADRRLRPRRHRARVGAGLPLGHRPRRGPRHAARHRRSRRSL
ncbi:MAG: Protocatechuate 3,4-dioxygenase beta chain, partial [uncultured Actinomycetospora sp.]